MDKITVAGFKLIGLKLDHKTTNENGQSGIDCGTLWQQFEREGYTNRIPEKLTNEVYAVYFDYEGDYTRPFSYFIGCKVKADAIVPDNMASITIRAGSFTKVTAGGIMPDCIANSWKAIWDSDINRAYLFDFEVYDERSADWSNAEVEIFVSCI